MADFARMVNEVLGREAAKVARSKKGLRIDIDQEDLLELVEMVSSPRFQKYAT